MRCLKPPCSTRTVVLAPSDAEADLSLVESSELQSSSSLPSLGLCRVPRPEDADMGNRRRPESTEKENSQGRGLRWKITDCRTGRTFGRQGRWMEGRGGFPEELVLEQL